MFKPNVRGVSKRELRFSFSGWRSSENFVIQHRYPWRKNWVEQLSTDETIKPLLARSGNIYLSKELPVAKAIKFKTPRHKRIAVFGSAVFTLLLLVIPTIDLEFDSHVAATSEQQTRQSASSVDCESILMNPEVMIQEWLAGKPSHQLTITEKQRAVLGGLQFRRVSIACDQQRSDLSLTMTLTQGEWHLKKFTRLEN